MAGDAPLDRAVSYPAWLRRIQLMNCKICIFAGTGLRAPETGRLAVRLWARFKYLNSI